MTVQQKGEERKETLLENEGKGVAQCITKVGQIERMIHFLHLVNFIRCLADVEDSTIISVNIAIVRGREDCDDHRMFSILAQEVVKKRAGLLYFG